MGVAMRVPSVNFEWPLNFVSKPGKGKQRFRVDSRTLTGAVATR